MRDDMTDFNSHELLPTPSYTDRSHPPSSYGGDEREAPDHVLLPRYKTEESLDNGLSQDRPPSETKWPAWAIFQHPKELILFLGIIITAIPVILLLRYAPMLSAKLASQACLPNGDFMLPGTASIWDTAYLFSVSITVQGANSDWSYTHVKILDIVWDVVMGRGCQLLLVYVAYQSFSRCLAYVMETRAVSYQTYSAVAFNSTSLSSVWHYFVAIGSRHSDRGWWNWYVFSVMILTSLYVVSMPTLFSAMTGYAALFDVTLEMQPPNLKRDVDCRAVGGCLTFPCGGSSKSGDPAMGPGLVPGWGVVLDSIRVHYSSPWPISVQDAYDNHGDAYYLRAYYERYETAYQALSTDPACQHVSNLTECQATNIPSVMSEGTDYSANLDAPLLNIQLWGSNSTTGLADFWLCDDQIINVNDFNPGNVTATCNAAPNYFTGVSYQWGFSFLLTLIVCILNVVFSIMVYALWMEARRNSIAQRVRKKKVHPSGVVEWRVVDRPSTITNVMRIAEQARLDHGDEVFGWDSRRLNKEVWKGRQGIRARKTVADGDGGTGPMAY